MASTGAARRPRRQTADRPSATAPAPITIIAIAFASGLTAGRLQPHPWIWPWIGLATVAAALSWRFGSRRRTALLLAAAASFALGAAWLTVRHRPAGPLDLRIAEVDPPALVRLRGTATTAPELRPRPAASMSAYDYRRPGTYFSLRVNAQLDDRGVATPAEAMLLVRVAETVAPFRAGDRVETVGYLRPPRAARNPGDRSAARADEHHGVLFVERRELLVVHRRDRPGAVHLLRRFRQDLQRRATAWLLADLPRSASPDRDALLTALILGRRRPSDAQIDDAFRRLGLAHYLAISGLHLGIVVGATMLLLTLGGHARRRHGVIVILVTLGYLTLIDVRMPVLRAALMAVALGIGQMAGRRWRADGLVAAGALTLLLWKPDELFRAGFQLSFGVVLGLIHLVGPAHRRWFGPPRPHAASIAAMLGHWLLGAVVVATVAWAVATPIIVHHFGTISPWTVPLSVVALPAIAGILLLGYAKLALAPLLPTAALLAGVALAVATQTLVSIVLAIDALPGRVLHVPPASPIWTAAALLCVVAWGRGWLRRRYTAGAVLILAVWLLWPLAALRGVPLRIDMLDVGDGSCYVLRSGGRAALFDAGSSSDPGAGRRSIVPALRALGVRRIDAILISHANLDHFSAVVEVVDAFPVERVVVTPQFTAAAAAEPRGPANRLLAEVARRLVSVRTAVAGDAMRLGAAELRWLSPLPDDSMPAVNDDSMVIRLRAAGRSVLLAGDIQTDAMTRLFERGLDVGADVLELPHHGSFHGAAVEFVARVRPSVVMQSTGAARWREDRWADALRGVERLVTARDGAGWVEIDEGGAVTVGRFIDGDGSRSRGDRP